MRGSFLSVCLSITALFIAAQEPSLTQSKSSDGASAWYPVPSPGKEALVVQSSVRILPNNNGGFQGRTELKAWTPDIVFNLVGPLSLSSRIIVSYRLQGKPWFSVQADPQKLAAGQVAAMRMGLNVDSNQKSQHVGAVDFDISEENQLQSSKRSLFKGHFRVNKMHVGNEHPNYKNDFRWYVNQDWKLNTAYLDFSRQGGFNGEPPLYPSMMSIFHFRTAFRTSSRYTAHLFYKGEEVSSVEGIQAESDSIQNDFKKVGLGWEQIHFQFIDVLGHRHDRPGSTTDAKAWNLAQHPGDYEIKVLRDGALARSANFTIRADGSMDRSINESNGLNGTWTLLPAKVIGKGDGIFDVAAWNSETLWNAAPKGFSPR
jgi:hypothetical protein